MTETKFDNVKLGDIFYSSWGYNMTIVDFYKVIKKIGKATLVLQRLGQKVVSGTGGWSGEVVADPTVNIGDAFRARFGKRGSLHGRYDCEHLWPWDGRPKYFNNLD